MDPDIVMSNGVGLAAASAARDFWMLVTMDDAKPFTMFSIVPLMGMLGDFVGASVG
jgi:hypothetical protein